MEIENYFIISCIINIILVVILLVKSKNLHQLGVKYDALYGENSELIGRNAGLKSNIESFKKEREETAIQVNKQLLGKTKQIKDASKVADALQDDIGELNKALEIGNKAYNDLTKEADALRDNITEQSDKIKHLSGELKIAQKNDTPKDPKTGKFVSNKKSKSKKK